MDKKQHLDNFLKALDAVQQDFTCGVCSQLCKKPVTLSKCFHIICSEHFDSLIKCPTCGVDLKDSKTFTNEGLERSIAATEELSKMFEKFKPTEQANAAQVNNDLSVNIPIPNSNEENATGESSKPKNGTSMGSCKFSKSVNKRNSKGQTALHIACRLGKNDKIVKLLNQGADPNTKDKADLTPLHEVVQKNRLDLVLLLLKYNAFVDVPGQGNETPLHEAVRYKHRRIAKVLVKYGADINARNCKGETPLQLATGKLKDKLITTLDTYNHTPTTKKNISHMSTLHSVLDMENIRVYCSSQYRTVYNKLKKLSKCHNNLYIETKWSREVTHLVVDAEDGVCQASLNVLQGIVSCIWILCSKWLMQSTVEALEPFDKYEVIGVNSKAYTGPKTARYNKYKLLPGLFDGCHFYLYDFGYKYEISKSLVIIKSVLMRLINFAGGVVLERAPIPEQIPDAEKLVPYHAKRDGKLMNCSHYIIYKKTYVPKYNMQHLKALPITWLIECIEKYELCDPW